VLDEAAAGVALPRPRVPVLVIASDDDTDIPPATSQALAEAWSADFLATPGSHVDPLLGRQAPALARHVLAWHHRKVASGDSNVSNAP